MLPLVSLLQAWCEELKSMDSNEKSSLKILYICIMIMNLLNAWDSSRNVLFVHLHLFLLVGCTSYFSLSSCLAPCRANKLKNSPLGRCGFEEGYDFMERDMVICITVILKFGNSLSYFPYYFGQYLECILVLHLLHYVNKLFMSSNKYVSKYKIWIKTKLIFMSSES